MRLEAQGITVKAGGCSIVENATLEIKPGEVVGLIGPNGAGKSTLLKAIVGVRELHGGRVLLDGQDVSELSPRERARRLSFLPQERRVEWRLSVHDVVMLGRYPHHAGFGGPTAADRDAVERALGAVDATGLQDRAATVLSGGEKARVLLARTLAVEAPVLIADEPIAALDPFHQLQVMEILRAQAAAGRGVLVVLHDLALAARFMDRIVLMHRGEIVADGHPDAVLSREHLREVYHVTALGGVEGGERWLVPWMRTPPDV